MLGAGHDDERPTTGLALADFSLLACAEEGAALDLRPLDEDLAEARSVYQRPPDELTEDA